MCDEPLQKQNGLPHTRSHTINIPKPNIELRVGDRTMGAVLSFREKNDIIHRLKWWMFCKIFPFKYEWIESENKK